MKSQSAIEFLSVVSLGLIVLVLTSYLGYNYITNYFFDTNSMDSKQTVSITTSAANLVYSQGLNASTKVTINMPNDVVLNRTYVYGKEINIRFSDPPKDAIGFSAAPIYGTIPTKPGVNVLYLQMTHEGVKIKVNDNISFIGVQTYNDTARQNKDSSFDNADTVYYQVKLEHFDNTPADSDIEIRYYYPNGTAISSSSVSTTNSVYNGTLSAAGGTLGFRLISVYITNERILGTALFNVTS